MLTSHERILFVRTLIGWSGGNPYAALIWRVAWASGCQLPDASSPSLSNLSDTRCLINGSTTVCKNSARPGGLSRSRRRSKTASALLESVSIEIRKPATRSPGTRRDHTRESPKPPGLDSRTRCSTRPPVSSHPRMQPPDRLTWERLGLPARRRGV